ncbi:hypothetical protein Tco_1181190, partial [Tanacetum coccineum]
MEDVGGVGMDSARVLM